MVRIEQLFPLPTEQIRDIIKKYNTNDVVWAQEEPRNMGSWSHLLVHLDEAKKFRIASRKFSGSPASGSTIRFVKRQNDVINYVFNKKNSN